SSCCATASRTTAAAGCSAPCNWTPRTLRRTQPLRSSMRRRADSRNAPPITAGWPARPSRSAFFTGTTGGQGAGRGRCQNKLELQTGQGENRRWFRVFQDKKGPPLAKKRDLPLLDVAVILSSACH